MLYIHEVSQSQVIDQDIEETNVLLNADMNPEVAAFEIGYGTKVHHLPAQQLK